MLLSGAICCCQGQTCAQTDEKLARAYFDWHNVRCPTKQDETMKNLHSEACSQASSQTPHTVKNVHSSCSRVTPEVLESHSRCQNALSSNLPSQMSFGCGEFASNRAVCGHQRSFAARSGSQSVCTLSMWWLRCKHDIALFAFEPYCCSKLQDCADTFGILGLGIVTFDLFESFQSENVASTDIH